MQERQPSAVATTVAASQSNQTASSDSVVADEEHFGNITKSVNEQVKNPVNSPTGNRGIETDLRPADDQTANRLTESFAQLPLGFEPNVGQVNSDSVKFVSRTQGYNLFLNSTKATMVLRQPVSEQKNGSEKRRRAGRRQLASVRQPMQAAKANDQKYKQTSIEMNLVGANKEASAHGADELEGKSNYFIGNDSSEWRANVASYKKVRFEEIYSGINLEYYGNQRQLEYDFAVQPNADPAQIKLKFAGVKKVTVDEQTGELVIKTKLGEIRQKKPFAYQKNEDGETVEIKSGYKVTAGKKEVSFSLGEYDKNKQLTIDPVVLVYSTFHGGSGFELGNAIQVDGQGNIYIAGATASLNFPTTPGTVQTTYGGGTNDLFVSKLSASGSQLIFSTYLGGSSKEFTFGPLALSVDANFNVYLGGMTTSANFPTTPGAYQTVYRGNQDGIVVKLNPTGNQLLYSTFVGGTGDDWLRDVKIDGQGNAYIMEFGGSTDMLTTPGVYQTVNNGGGSDLYVAKLNPAGSGMVYLTYLGGTSLDYGYGIAIDGGGNAYLTGETCNNGTFPTTPGVVQPNFAGFCDAFLTKINPTATALVYSTFHGGSVSQQDSNGYDYAWDIAVDGQGNAYLGGGTSSVDFPKVTPIQSVYGGGVLDGYVTKFNSTATARLYSTYIGGSGQDQIHAIALDNAGSVYFTGETNSPNFPLAQARQSTIGGGIDAVVGKISAAGNQLLYSTFHGGSSEDRGYAIAVDNAGFAYIAGITRSETSFPLLNARQPVFGGFYDAFISKFGDPPPQVFSISGRVTTNSISAAGVTVVLSGAASRQTITNSNGDYQFFGLAPGNYTVNATLEGATFSNSSPLPVTITNSSITDVNFAYTVCPVSLNPTVISVSEAGGPGSITVTAASGCVWTASSSVPWLVVTQATGTGNGTAGYFAQRNYGAARSGNIVINGQIFTLTQAAGSAPISEALPNGEIQPEVDPCESSFTVNAASQSRQIVSYTGQNVAPFTVNIASNCQWTAVANKPWIVVTSPLNNTGSQQVTFTVNQFAGNVPRSGEIAINGNLFTVIQTPNFPQEWNLTIPQANSPVFNVNGGDGSFNISCGAPECRWRTFVPNPRDSWIELAIPPGDTGTVYDTIARFTIKPNQGAAQRFGTIIIGDKSYTVTQASGTQASCNYQLSSTAQTLAPVINATGSFNIQAGPGCAWQAASSDPSWLSATGNGAAEGTISFKALSANTSSNPRTATITVGGRTFTVTQNGSQQACSYTIAPGFQDISDAGTSGVVNVTTAAGCPWTASSQTNWLSVGSGAAGSGSGTMIFIAQLNNTSAARVGTLTIAGQIFTVNQAAGAAGCSFTLSSSGTSLPAGGGSGSFNVSSGTGCGWTASANDSWITITGGGTGNGNGTVSYTVQANSGQARVGTITAGGQTFTIEQAGGVTPSLSIGNVSLNEGSGGGNTAFNFSVTLSQATTQTVTVNYGTANGTATAGQDFTATSGTLTFAPNETSKTVTVQVTADTLVEPDETFTVSLSSPTNATIAAGTGTGTILNDDAGGALQFSLSSYTVNENGTNAVITVNRTGGAASNVSVNYATSNGTATAGADYTASSGTLTFAANETSKTFNVPIINDAIDEPNETVNLALSNPSGGGVLGTPASAELTIIDDDAAPVLSINSISLNEGNSGTTPFNFTVNLTGATSQTVSVNYATANGTATAPSDYQTASGTVNFAPGETSKIVTVLVNGDTQVEPNETFAVNLSGATNATIGNGQGTGTIQNDDVVNNRSAFDYDGDRKADLSVFRPSAASWYISQSSNNAFVPRQFGASGDLIAPADYDGDGKTDLCVFRPSDGGWYRINSSDNVFVPVQFGSNGDIPVPGDFDGDGKANIAVFRPSIGYWLIARPTGVPAQNFDARQFGLNTDKPLAATDFDGDGKADLAVYRPSNGYWYRINSSNDTFSPVKFGIAEDLPVPADYDGDGKTDLAVFRPSVGDWYLIFSASDSFTGFHFGISEDKPAPADFDGDGKADYVVFRPSSGTWYLLRSTQGFTGFQFGAQGDVPTPGAFIR